MNQYIDKKASLIPATISIICDKATEYPHTGAYNAFATQGSYLCRRCGLALFRGENKFNASCGWPSFDEDIAGSVKQEKDSDGQRTEIVCARCNAHLGHVFSGELFTHKNLRYCVNSASLDFVMDIEVCDTEEAIVAGGCFWGIEHAFRMTKGVLKAESGYTGGHTEAPTYEQVCHGNTGHYEAVRVVFDRNKTDYAHILKRFFEIHDSTQANGQGPDIGHQYQSAIFYFNQAQKQEAKSLKEMLKSQGYPVATRLVEAMPFWPAEHYHQEYYLKHPIR